MHKIVFKEVNKKYDNVHAVKNVSFEIENGETFVLIGSSGSGKTTTLKMINRLIDISSGKILIDNKNILEKDPITLRRNIGYVIQSIGLFPHITIGDNISIILKIEKKSDEYINKRVDELLNLVGLDPEIYKNRFPAELSGGQQQRIGVARALAGGPDVILMDEPFGALDPITREALHEEFISLLSEIEKTIVFVTHDIFEAFKLGDRICLMDKGEIIQIGKPKDLLFSPVNDFVREFIGSHHFHLVMLLTKIKDVMIKSDGRITTNDIHLDIDSTFLDALNLFKKYDINELKVKGKAKSMVGKVKRKDVVSKLGELID